MQPRTAILWAVAISLLCADVVALAVPWDDAVWNWRRAWPMALVVTQLALAAAAIVWAPAALVTRGIAAALALGFGCLIVIKGDVRGWGAWLGLWLLLGATVAGLCWMLRLAGLQLVEGSTPTHLPDEPQEAASRGLGPRQFSLAALCTAALLVALLAGALRYVQLPEEVWLVGGLLSAGWAVISVACLLIVGLEGSLWLRAVFAMGLVAFAIGVGQLLDLAALSPNPPNVFLQVSTFVLPMLGASGLAIRAAGLELRWDD